MSIDRSHYPGVPDDFPIQAKPSGLAGAQPKMDLVEEDGKYYALGTSPSEVLEVFQMCDDLADQMGAYCTRKLPTFHGEHEQVMTAAFQGLLQKHWCTAEQSAWIMVEAARRLGWDVPPDTFKVK